jgi:hypothetical protein
MKTLLLTFAIFLLVSMQSFGITLKEIDNQIKEYQSEINGLKKDPPKLPDWLIKKRIKALSDNIKKLKQRIKNKEYTRFKLVKVIIKNAYGYDGIWYGWADVRLKMNGKDITKTIKNSNNPLFDNLDIDISESNNTIDVMDEDPRDFEIMGTIKLKFNFPSGVPGTSKNIPQNDKVIHRDQNGKVIKGFDWEVVIRVIY